MHEHRSGMPSEQGLRARKRSAAMRTIQRVALDLFDARGFDAVTIEEVAAAAEVSPSSVYRYFGTKEGVVIHDEYDDTLLDAVLDQLKDTDPWTAARRALGMFSWTHTRQDELTTRRMRYYLEVPAVRRGAFVILDDYAWRLGDALVESPVPPQRSLGEAVAVTGSILFALWLAAEEWYRRGCPEDLIPTLLRALDAITPTQLTASTEPGDPR